MGDKGLGFTGAPNLQQRIPMFKQFCFALLLISSLLSATETHTVAVLDFEALNISQSEASTLTERFRAELTKTGVLKVMARGEMASILEEQEFQQTGCVDQECAVELGQIIAVEKIISGSVAKLGGLYTVNIKLLDVETGKVDKSISEDCDCPIEKLLLSTMNTLAFRVAGLGVDKSSSTLEITRGDAFLFIKTEPAEAYLYIDGKMVDGKSPVTLENLQAGKHTITAKKGDLIASSEVVLSSNKVERLEMVLTKEQTRVKIISEPSDAEVYLRGVTPTHKISPDGVTPGVFSLDGMDSTVTFTLFKIGYADTTIVTPITPNQLNTINVSLAKTSQETIRLQKQMVKARKQRKIGLSLDISGALMLAGGALCYYFADEDYEDAEAAKLFLQSSAIKSGTVYEQQLALNKEKSRSGDVKQTMAFTLIGTGASALTAGLIFTF